MNVCQHHYSVVFIACLAAGMLVGCGNGDDTDTNGESDAKVGADTQPDASSDSNLDGSGDTEQQSLSDAELQAAFDSVAGETEFNVDKNMGFPQEQSFRCDAFGKMSVQNVGSKHICLTLKDDPKRHGAPAVSADGVDYYLELPKMNQATFEGVLTEFESGKYDGQTVDFTPVLTERPDIEVTVGTAVEITFETTGAKYTSCTIVDENDETVVSDESLAQNKDEYSTFLGADIPPGTYRANCEFGNSFGAFSVDGTPGIPGAATVTVESSNNDWPGMTTFYFEPDSSIISDDGRARARDHSDYLDNNPDAQLRIEGHADRQEAGNREDAMALGDDRANAVRDFLVIRGISRDRITAVSYGSERPLFYSLDDDARELNRRVEIFYE